MRASICISCFQLEHFIEATIASALAQDVDDFEVIVVDDGSTDASWDRIRSFGSRIVAMQQENCGQIAAATAALQRATGDVVLFLDGDDLLRPGTLRTVLGAFDQTPRPAVVQWRVEVIDDRGRASGHVLPRHAGSGPMGDIARDVLRIGSWPWHLTSATAYDAEVARALLPPADDPRDFLDHYMSGLAPLHGPVVSLDVVGTGYRRHAGNVSGALAGEPYARDQIDRALRQADLVAARAVALGLPRPRPPLERPDPALLGFRLWSLRLDRDRHPVPGDRRWRLVVRGIAATLQSPWYGTRHKLGRSCWFVLAGVLPRWLFVRLLARYAPDGPVTGPAA